MDIQYFKEFIVFTQYLNITKASSELHMTPSSLSKHMKQVEREVGCPLVDMHRSKLELTEVGILFLNRIQKIVREYDDLLEECQTHQIESRIDIVAQRAPYEDAGSKAYHALLYELGDGGIARIKYAKASHRDFTQSLRAGKLDLFLEYRIGDIEDLESQYSEEGLCSKHLTTEPLALWCSKDSELVPGPLPIEKLSSVSIMVPTDTCSPTRILLEDLRKTYGVKPMSKIVSTSTGIEFVFADQMDAAYLYPLSQTQSSMLQLKRGMATVLVAEEVEVHAFAIAASPCWSKRKREAEIICDFFKNEPVC